MYVPFFCLSSKQLMLKENWKEEKELEMISQVHFFSYLWNIM